MSKDKTLQLQEKIDQLNQQAWDIRVNDSLKAFTLSRRTLKLARTINYKKGIAEATRSMGFCYVRLSKNDEALPVLDESLSLFKELGDLKGQAVVYEYLGVIKRNRGDLGAALDLLFKAVALSQQTGSSENEAIHHYQLGVTYKYLGNFDKALDSLFKSISIHKENKNRFYPSYPINVIGSIYFETGDYTRALEYYKDGLKLRQEFEDKLGESGSLDNIGYTFFKLKKYAQALKYCKQSLAISKATGDKRSQASVLQHLAEIYAHAADTKQAIASSNASRKIRKVTGDRRGEAEILVFLASLPQQDTNKVVDWIKEALQIAKETRSPEIQSKAHHCLYNYYKQEGKFREANVQLEKHFKLEKELQKNSVNQKIANLEISRKAEETSKKAESVMQKNEELTRLNKELEIEASLERVRAVAMSMHRPNDILDICKGIYKELPALGFKDVRNTLINFWDDPSRSLIDYDYSDFAGANVSKLAYSSHPVFEQFQKKIRSSKDAFAQLVVTKEQLASWRKRRRDSGEYEDPRLHKIDALYYYFYSIGVGAVGISSFSQLTPENLEVLKRFRNVFDLAYRRHLDIHKAEAQAREAHIQLALERVRASTMAMQHSEELSETVAVLFGQFKSLGEEPERMAIEIVNEKENVFEIWATQHGGSQLNQSLKVSLDEPYVMQKMYKAWKEKKKSITIDLQGKELEGYYQFLKKQGMPVDRKKFGVRRVQNVAAFSKGILTIITPEPRPAETIQLLERFAKVFDSTYTRFLDLQKAEAQSRESQIQLALERVRARTMAMQKSDELPEAANLLFQQIQSLGMPAWSAGYCTWNNEEKRFVTLWMSSEGVLQPPFGAPTTEDELFIQMRKGQEGGKTFHVVEMGGDKLVKHYKYMRTLPGMGDILDSIIDAGHPLPSFQIMHHAYFSKGFLLFITYEPVPDAHDIFKRFGKVFDQTYTRFLDLQKAEAQAREAQIEAALEKVRSRSLAMHKSDEIKEVVKTTVEKIQELNIEMNGGVSLVTFDAGSKDMHHWLWIPGQLEDTFKAHLPWFDHSMFHDCNGAREQGLELFAKVYSGKEKDTYFDHLFHRTHFANGPEELKAWVMEQPYFGFSFAIQKHSGIFLNDYTGKLFSKETNEILVRFSKVFEQSYIRFLDLQKAETQAKEAKIEAALEKVRSRSLAMHKSDELQEVVTTVFDRLKDLGVRMDAINLDVFKGDKRDAYLWTAVPGQVYSKEFHIPYIESVIFKDIYQGMIEGKGLHSAVYSREEKNEFLDHLFTHSDFKHIPQARKDMLYATEGSTVAVAYATHTAIIGQRYSIMPFNDEETDILKRFAKVFEQCYTRFRDLEKAEGQAREAQVEASLERVRAKAMAMHHSVELDEVLETLFDQFDILGIHPVSTHITLIDVPTNTFTFRETGKGGRKNFGVQTVAIDSMDIWKEAADRWKSSDPMSLNILHFPKESLPMVWRLFHESFASMPDGAKIIPDDYPDGIYHTAGNCKFGYIGMNQTRKATPEEEQIVLKFAVEFGRLYQRFLDLQKAEVQIREAKIEAALEKVRSSSLAMHKSEELKNVVKVVFDNFQSLGLMSIDSVNINIFHEGSKDFDLWLAAPGQDYARNFRLPYLDHPIANEFFAARENGETLHQKVYAHDVKNAYFQYMFEHSDNKYLPEDRKRLILNGPAYAVATGIGRHTSVFIHNYSGLPFSYEIQGILVRFTRVFDQSYRRFLDLQMSEAQARESQIELSLERVRAKTMAMHDSQDVGETVAVMFDELLKLGVETFRCGIGVMQEKDNMELWTAKFNDEGKADLVIGGIDMSIHPLLQGAVRSWRDKKESYSYDLKDQDLIDYFSAINNHPGYPVTYEISKLPALIFHNEFYFPEGVLFSFSLTQLRDEERKIFKRFAGVFGQTYRRFLDLQKAEAQSREAHIEASLERVRSKAMAMHSSQDLHDTIVAFYHELETFSITPRRCGVGLIDKESHVVELSTINTTEQGKTVEVIGKLKLQGHPVLEGIYDNWISQKEYYPVLRGNDIRDYYKLIRPQIPFPDYPTDAVQHGYFFYFPEGGVYAWTDKELGEEELNIYRRFTSVLSLTYKRYTELREAEAQTREAQIEVALERVRSKAMAMHKTEDLNDAVAVVFEELDKLDLGVLRVGISVLNKDKRCGSVWLTSVDEGKSVQVSGDESFDIHPLLQGSFNAWLRQEDFNYLLEGDDLTAYYKAVKAAKFRLPDSQMLSSGVEFKRQYLYVAVYNSGGLFAFRETEFPVEAKKVMKRFAAVFDLTYKRFLDLQRAEAQSREAHIQLALERVRARTMAMQKSEELADAAVVLFQQFAALGETPDRISIGIIDEQNGSSDVWATDQAGTQVNIRFKARNDERTTVRQILEAWKDGKKSTVVDLQGKDLEDWITYLRAELGMKIDDSYFHGRRLHQVSFFSQGWLNITTLEPLPAETLQLLDRFAAVFNLTYTRFIDLKKAEAQAREAQIEASLERVRANVIAMNNSNELQQISYVFGDQLRQLKIDWQFSYFWLIEEEKDTNTFWITWPDNTTSVTAYSLGETDAYTRECLVEWKAGNKMHSNNIPPEQVDHFLDTYRQLVHDAGDSANEVMQLSNFQEGVFYYDAMMKYGSFGVCMNRPATEEENKIQSRFAVEFERAYTRFLDLKQAEFLARQAEKDLEQLKIEKKRTEEALSELQVTQKQLIQSEKMASLGELTAGIAHEIQNPLNFVNNFSEVSNELLDEMVEEVKKGNYEEVQALVNDVKQNLEKINHHGKRADGIVKGMLQHSRSGSANKEPTDINKLADEYLRLAYHGLRAKDKSFNATMKTDYDESIGIVSIFPQDIGRVILNLITNAFYVVNEKKKQGIRNYEPTVSVATKKCVDTIEVSVKDNGSGIPAHVLDKIFQPFFTTKPTGQGTGLGLSLSYDIVKAHGGQLSVRTKEGEGSEFTIQLPNQSS